MNIESPHHQVRAHQTNSRTGLMASGGLRRCGSRGASVLV